MKQWLLFITLLVFILLPSFVFAQDNAIHIIAETIPTQSNNSQNNNYINPKPTITPTIIKKETLNIFQKIKLFFSDFFERLFIKKETINKTAKLLSPTQITKLAPTINISKSMADSKQVLVDLKKALNVTALIIDMNIFNWITESKEIAPLIGQGFTLGVSASSQVGKYGNFTQYPDPNYLKDLTEEVFKPLQGSIDEFFISNGFQKDEQNTFRSDKSYILLFMGYKKGDLKCLIRLNPRSSLFGNFFCGIVDQTRFVWRKELTSTINISNDPNIIVSVNKLLSNYAQGSVGSATGEGGGAGWYAVKINGRWKEVWRGQQFTFTSCKSLQKYNFPKEIINLEPDICSKYQLPDPTIKVKTAGVGLTIKYWETSYYCEQEVVPTIGPIPTMYPCPKKDDSIESSFEYHSCITQQLRKQGEIRQQNIESLKKYCTILTPTPK